LQNTGRLCQQHGKNDSANARQGLKYRYGTLHLLLFRPNPSTLAGKWLSKEAAQLVELPVHLFELPGRKLDVRDEHADMRHGSLDDTWSHGQCRLA